ncbi:RHS repeat domain-containing protein [Pseudovibrio sp. Alg231-02]|uniref:RHS repeat domain-containing protein n=1 Tax=Pseudovibrio sp. Alg231-02 TaxID=1922223 RepID=UPI000D54D5E3|nr:RHS repeat-associated core domain-containing protein [Pseudovibrio sp. Alg231-02]
MSNSQYRGSQAFNQTLQVNEYVNKNTGSLTIRIPLVELRGKTEAIGLNLSLSYLSGADGQLGMPEGWGFNLPFVTNDETLTYQGKTFVIDLEWTDSSGYQSGLKYLNDHGQKFEKFVRDQPLPSGDGSYRYLLSYNDGSKSYFDATGKPVLQSDLFGNSLQYRYADQLTGVVGNKLTAIVDSYGQTVTLSYNFGSLIVTLPDGSTQEVTYADQGVARIINQSDAPTEFAYINHADQTVISEISYGSGLTTTLTYTSIDYLDEDGNQGSFPAVQKLQHSNLNREILDATQYVYGSASDGNTFTGFADGYRLSDSGDSLMSGQNPDYLYDVLMEKLAKNGSILSASRVFYNYLHSPVRSFSYLLSQDGSTIEAYRSLYEYHFVSDQHDRSVNMSKPVSVTYSVYDPDAQSWHDYKKIESDYNNFGLLVSSRTYDLTDGDRSLVRETTRSYVAAGWGGAMPLEKVERDGKKSREIKSTYTLTEDQKNISQITLFEKTNESVSFMPTKTKRYSYDDEGVQVSWQLTWAEGHSGDAGDLTSISSSITHAFDASSGQLTVSTTDANGGVGTSIFDMRLPMAPRVQQKTPEGKTYNFSYDAAGRMTESTDPLGQSKTYTYTTAVTSNGSADHASNTVVTRNANDYMLRSTFDALGRFILLEDNGDPTQATPELNRQLEAITYNLLGLKAEETGMTGLTTRYAYDSLGRETSRTDAQGNEYTLSYDDPNLTIQSHLNGTLRSNVEYNGLSQNIVVKSYPYSDTTATQFYMHTYSYNGFGLQDTVATYSMDGDEQTRISTTTSEYNPEGAVVSETFAGSAADEALQADVVTVTSYDLLGNPVQVGRTVSYNGEPQPEATTAVLSFDAMGNLVKATNQSEQSQVFTYNADNELITYQRHDRLMTRYTYDDAGQLTNAETGDTHRSFSYLSNGLVSEISEGEASIRYGYSLDGTASTIQYPDDTLISFSKDDFSRVVGYTLPDGTQSSYTYTDTNQISEQITDGVSLRNTWGSTNNQHGVLLSQIVQDSLEHSQNTNFAYDGYGYPQQIDVIDGEGAKLLSTTATRDSWRNVTNLTISSESIQDAAVNLAKTMSYNGLNQLVSSRSRNLKNNELSSEAYSFDGAGNILAYTHDDDTQEFQYNEINQLISDGITYDENGRMLKDVDGTSYSYDDLGRLTTVELTDGTQVQYSYNAEGMLSAVLRDGATNQLHTVSNSVAGVSQSVSQEDDEENSHAILWSNTLPYAQRTATSLSLYSRVMNSVRLHSTDGDYEGISVSDYGLVTSTTPLTTANSFNWEGEYTDAVTELSFMNARWYSPKSMRFLTPDPLYSINTYGYANGNPIANFDPTGLTSAKEVGIYVLALAVGIAAGVAVGALVGLAFVGTEGVLAAIAASSLAGAAGSVAGDLAASLVTGEEVTGTQLGIDALGGLLGGAAGASVERAIGWSVERGLISSGTAARPLLTRNLIFAGTSGGIFDAAVSAGVTSIAKNQPFFSRDNIINIAVGGATGAQAGYSEARNLQTNVLPTSTTTQGQAGASTTTNAVGNAQTSTSLSSNPSNTSQIATRPRSNARAVNKITTIKAATKYRGLGGVMSSRFQTGATSNTSHSASYDVFEQNFEGTTTVAPLVLVRGNFHDAQKIAESIQTNILKVVL